MSTDFFSIDYTELDKTVETLFPQGETPSFSDIICGLMDGEIPFSELFSYFTTLTRNTPSTASN